MPLAEPMLDPGQAECPPQSFSSLFRALCRFPPCLNPNDQLMIVSIRYNAFAASGVIARSRTLSSA